MLWSENWASDRDPLDKPGSRHVSGQMQTIRRSLLCLSFLLFSVSCSLLSPQRPPQIDTVIAQMEFNRSVTFRLLAEIEKTGKADHVLRWSVGKHAPIGWHLMHLAASEDRFAVMLGAPGLVSEDYATKFSSGKDAARDVPSAGAVREYLDQTRASLVQALEKFDLSRIDEKPAADAPFDYGTIIKILSFHEAHHQGQAHATFNIYKDP